MEGRELTYEYFEDKRRSAKKISELLKTIPDGLYLLRQMPISQHRRGGQETHV